MKTKTTDSLVRIDGSQGEGGGQVLRSALSLSAITGRPFELSNIRAGRSKPGLMRQHLTCVEAVATFCGATTSDLSVGEARLLFEPGEIQSEDTSFAIGTAGSTSLVAQAILPVMLHAQDESRIVISGGTHVMAAPCTDFLTDLFVPALEEMGAEVELRLSRHGFFPAGGGEIELRVRPWNHRLAFERTAFPEGLEIDAQILSTRGVPTSVANREIQTVEGAFAHGPAVSSFVFQPTGTKCDGNAVLLRASDSEATRALFCGLGRRGRSGRKVAQGAIREMKRYLSEGVPVDEFLADQLLLPLALGAGGSFRTGPLSTHFTTNIDILAAFLDIEIDVQPEANGHHLVNVAS